ncbi:RagB/SusD family nutrient uptake outer membrane protein [Halosquirtibacter xylanolyticus]|uniref:RagB/SusD family nutrient uptake outer membrane protein n=1 Tax=Halosquirtibacter xylanolyticus TaxID=3374599 RepID=UPI00374A0EDD|nr:RagB/SusD family nutrient uptake outer membrane protein [Prolixibacteraceae bacterium]
MKQYIKHFVWIVFITIISGCDSWVDSPPENGLIKEKFWKSEQDVESALIDSYATLQKNINILFLHGEVRSDQLSFYRAPGYYQQLRSGRIIDNNKMCNWSFLYKVINQASAVVENAPTAAENDKNFLDVERDALIAEARFIRSLAYFYLVRIWKEVPILPYSYETDNNGFELNKSSEKEVLDYIITDLKLSLPHIKHAFSEAWENHGRGTVYAVHSLLADTYLWRDDEGDLDLALEHCKSVFADSKRGLLSSDQWFSIFSEGNTAEGIFEIQCENLQGQSGPWYKLFLNAERPEFIFNKKLQDKDFSIYDETDIRGENATYNSETGLILKYITPDPTIVPLKYYPNRQQYTCNFIVYRAADIILMMAEIYAEKGMYKESMEQINKIRNRANATEITTLEESVTAYEDYILYERTRELYGEGKSWFDLLRIAKRNNYARKQMIIDKVLTSVSPIDQASVESALQDEYAFYLPISRNELVYNQQLIQNPFYQSK